MTIVSMPTLVIWETIGLYSVHSFGQISNENIISVCPFVTRKDIYPSVLQTKTRTDICSAESDNFPNLVSFYEKLHSFTPCE